MRYHAKRRNFKKKKSSLTNDYQEPDDIVNWRQLFLFLSSTHVNELWKDKLPESKGIRDMKSKQQQKRKKKISPEDVW